MKGFLPVPARHLRRRPGCVGAPIVEQRMMARGRVRLSVAASTGGRARVYHQTERPQNVKRPTRRWDFRYGLR